MSVIGRLDDQVWEKLIAPIAKRREREAEERKEEQEARREQEAQEEREESGEAK